MGQGAKVLLLFAAALAIVVGILVFFGSWAKQNQGNNGNSSSGNGAAAVGSPSAGAGGNSGGGAAAAVTTLSPIQQELDQRAAQMASELRQERRLNLNMVGQLRSYQEMLNQVQDYAQTVEKQVDTIEEILKNEFQEDVTFQASLYSGKKPKVVASHLEEFRASRVGAILAKMKEKEAGSVMDIWAKGNDPKVKAFYREVMAAYLNNKRRDLHPELYNQLADKDTQATNEDTAQR